MKASTDQYFSTSQSCFGLGQGAQEQGKCPQHAQKVLQKWMRDVMGVNKGRSMDAPRGKGWDAASKRVGRFWEEKDWDAAGKHAGMLWRRKGWDAPREGAGILLGEERTWMFQEKKVEMVPENRRKNMDALGTEGWDGPKKGTGILCGPRPLHLHPAAAQQQSTAPPLLAPRSLPLTSHRPIPLPALHS